MSISSVAQSSHYECPIPYQVCESASISSPGQVNPIKTTPHLILYFDMNKTLIASDKTGKKTTHDEVSAVIADRVVDRWDPSVSTPISYADYVKYCLLPNKNYSQEIKNQQKKEISAVLHVLKERNHPEYTKMQEIYDRAMAVLKNQEKQKKQVFKSFYRLIDFLKEQKIPYTLVIRTFGSDGSEVAKELNESFGEAFIAEGPALHRGCLDGSNDLYELITSAKRHLIIQDDWKWWSDHGQNWQYGKPFPVNLEDPNYISLFFDDNAGIDSFAPEENIVFPYDATTKEPIPPSQLIDQGRLIPVDMLEALCDENYYIQFIEKAIPNMFQKS